MNNHPFIPNAFLVNIVFNNALESIKATYIYKSEKNHVLQISYDDWYFIKDDRAKEIIIAILNLSIKCLQELVNKEAVILVDVDDWYASNSMFSELEKELSNQNIVIEKAYKGDYGQFAPKATSNLLIIGVAGNYTREELLISQAIIFDTIPKIDNTEITLILTIFIEKFIAIISIIKGY